MLNYILNMFNISIMQLTVYDIIILLLFALALILTLTASIIIISVKVKSLHYQVDRNKLNEKVNETVVQSQLDLILDELKSSVANNVSSKNFEERITNIDHTTTHSQNQTDYKDYSNSHSSTNLVNNSHKTHNTDSALLDNIIDDVFHVNHSSNNVNIDHHDSTVIIDLTKDVLEEIKEEATDLSSNLEHLHIEEDSYKHISEQDLLNSKTEILALEHKVEEIEEKLSLTDHTHNDSHQNTTNDNTTFLENSSSINTNSKITEDKIENKIHKLEHQSELINKEVHKIEEEINHLEEINEKDTGVNYNHAELHSKINELRIKARLIENKEHQIEHHIKSLKEDNKFLDRELSILDTENQKIFNDLSYIEEATEILTNKITNPAFNKKHSTNHLDNNNPYISYVNSHLNKNNSVEESKTEEIQELPKKSIIPDLEHIILDHDSSVLHLTSSHFKETKKEELQNPENNSENIVDISNVVIKEVEPLHIEHPSKHISSLEYQNAIPHSNNFKQISNPTHIYNPNIEKYLQGHKTSHSTDKQSSQLPALTSNNPYTPLEATNNSASNQSVLSKYISQDVLNIMNKYLSNNNSHNNNSHNNDNSHNNNSHNISQATTTNNNNNTTTNYPLNIPQHFNQQNILSSNNSLMDKITNHQSNPSIISDNNHKQDYHVSNSNYTHNLHKTNYSSLPIAPIVDSNNNNSYNNSINQFSNNIKTNLNNIFNQILDINKEKMSLNNYNTNSLRPSYSVQDLKPISIKQPQNQNTPIHIDNSIKNNYTHSTYKSNSSEYSNKNPITQYPQKVTKINPVFIPSNSTFNIKKDINNKLNELNNPFKTNNFQQQQKNPTNFDLSNAAFKGNKNSNSIHPNINHLSDIKISTIKSNLNNNIYRVK